MEAENFWNNLLSLKFTENQIKGIYRVLLAILNLGNIFHEKTSNDESNSSNAIENDLQNNTYVENARKLLGLNTLQNIWGFKYDDPNHIYNIVGFNRKSVIILIIG